MNSPALIPLPISYKSDCEIQKSRYGISQKFRFASQSSYTLQLNSLMTVKQMSAIKGILIKFDCYSGDVLVIRNPETSFEYVVGLGPGKPPGYYTVMVQIPFNVPIGATFIFTNYTNQSITQNTAEVFLADFYMRSYHKVIARQGTPPANGVAYAWAMNDGVGNSFADHMHGNTVSGAGVVWQHVAGFPLIVPTFNGTTLGAAVSDTYSNFDTPNPFSISFWVNSSNAGFQAVIGDLNGASMGWEVNMGGTVSLQLLNNYPNNWISVNTIASIADGATHNVVATYNGSGRAAGVSIYIDGVSAPVNIGADNLGGLSIASNLPVNIGGRTGNLYLTNATIADMLIYNRVLAASEVAGIFTAGPRIPA